MDVTWETHDADVQEMEKAEREQNARKDVTARTQEEVYEKCTMLLLPALLV